jgi:hypothetical protein
MEFKFWQVTEEKSGLVGFKLEVDGKSPLVFKDQEGMPGFRRGDRFVGGLDQNLSEVQVFCANDNGVCLSA